MKQKKLLTIATGVVSTITTHENRRVRVVVEKNDNCKNCFFFDATGDPYGGRCAITASQQLFLGNCDPMRRVDGFSVIFKEIN